MAGLSIATVPSLRAAEDRQRELGVRVGSEARYHGHVTRPCGLLPGTVPRSPGCSTEKHRAAWRSWSGRRRASFGARVWRARGRSGAGQARARAGRL